ncbi:MAG: ornithine--oxo-acid transaminase [Actinomycetota bacterium]
MANFLGAPGPGPERGPEALRQAGLVAALRRNGLQAEWRVTLVPGAGERMQALYQLLLDVADAGEDVVSSGAKPIFVGGDHSQAAGAWRGVGRALGTAPGLIWIDAHLDSHTPATSQSGNLHGMPLAALLGYGDRAMTDIPGPTLDPRRVAVVGGHSFEPAEVRFLDQLGVQIFGIDEIRQRGLAPVFADALEIANRDGGDFGISFDLDAIDPLEAPGVSTPVAGGIPAEPLRRALHGCLRDRACVGLEVVEYNPDYDPHGRTARLVIDLLESAAQPGSAELRQWEGKHGARNYAPLPVVLQAGSGCWLADVEGKRYLDLMSAYSAASFGHSHPRLVAALSAQAGRLAVTSRAFSNDRLPLLLRRLTGLFGYDRALPVNTGLEAVETALKAARKWAYKVKGVPEGQAEIIACTGNFHGRSIAIVGLSTEDQYRDGFGPFPTGLTTVPYGDAAALEAAITPNTAAFLVEPIQGEGGIVVPPAGYLSACAEICRRHRVLFVADEVQTGLGRTGRLLACEHEGVRPDGVILGKALGGGLLPVSAFLADDEVMQVFHPGDHGSTFGGNALAAAVALEALDVLEEEALVGHADELGRHLSVCLEEIARNSPAVREVRGRGLLAGIELNPQIDAHSLALALLEKGVLTRETHGTVLRLAPPLVISREELDWGLVQIADTLAAWGEPLPRAA